MQTFNDYLTKARIDFDKKTNSSNDEYLKFHAEIRYIIGDEFNKALKRVVGECGLQGVVHRTIGNCSKGYKQRIGLAAAMIHDPKILILDEPVPGLDPNQIVEIRGLIKKLGKEKHWCTCPS